MQELLWLLLPLAAASGWLAARRGNKGERRDCVGGTSPAYFRGLNYLLNEEPDKAIDVFVQLLEVDSDTVETHLALGNLFRRRGEVERAIRIHQNLIARPALSREQRGQALLELGLDYMRAGLYDRAENLFSELVDMKLNVRKALENLRDIYQQEKDWEACLRVSDRLESYSSEPLSLEKSHYYCELAEQAMRKGEGAKAQGYLKRALSTSRQCIRAHLLEAKLAIANDNCKQAVRLLTSVAEREPHFLAQVVPQLAECNKKMGDLRSLRSYLDGMLRQYPDASVTPLMADLIRDAEGEPQAISFLLDEIQQHPSLRALLRLIEMNARLSDAQATSMLFSLKQQLERLLAERPQYQCIQCGFVANTLHWQCPSCRSWSSIKHKPEIPKS